MDAAQLKGSQTAKGGFANEKTVVDRFITGRVTL